MGRVNTSSGNLNIRSSYSSSSTIIGKYFKNEIVQLIAKTSNGWYRTDKGYISADYVIGVRGEVFNNGIEFKPKIMLLDMFQKIY